MELHRNIPELRFPCFYDSWNKKKLGDVVEFQDSKRIPLSSEERKLKQGIYPYYGASGIIDYVEDYIFDGEFILLGEDGANILTRSTRLAYVISGKNWVNNHAHVMSTSQSTYFIAEALERLNYEKYNTGTAQPKLNSAVCKKIMLFIPTLAEQQKIASFLSAVDKRIELLQKKKDLLQDYKKGVMQQLFSQQLRFKDENRNDFPDWEEGLLSEVCELKHGYQFKSKDFVKNGIAIIKISNVIGNTLNLDSISFISSSRYQQFKKFEIMNGDILMSLTGNIGRVIEVKDKPFSLIQNYRVGNFTPSDEKTLIRPFLKYLLMSDLVFGRFNQLSNQSAQANFGKQDMDKIKVRIPKVQEQQKIASFLSAIDSKIETTKQQIEGMQTFKKGLLQQMFV